MSGRWSTLVAGALVVAVSMAACGADSPRTGGTGRAGEMGAEPAESVVTASRRPDSAALGAVGGETDEAVARSPGPAAVREGAALAGIEAPAATPRPRTPASEGARSGRVTEPDSSAGAGRASGVEEPAAVASDTRAAASDTTAAILRATAERYAGVMSLRADFVQVLNNTLLGQTTRSRGTMYQKEPGYFLMRFSEPAGDEIVSDGEYFWLYFPSTDAKQVIRTPRGSQGLDLRAQFIGDPVERFDAIYDGRAEVNGRSVDVLTLVPRVTSGYDRMKVWVDRGDHLIRRFELTESNGIVRHFDLTDLVVNPSLPDGLFRFTPPAGAQVIERG